MKTSKLILLFLLLSLVSCQKKASKDGNVAVEKQAEIRICGSSLGGGVEGLKELPAPTFRTGIGNSHLPITTQNKEAQRWFDQGLNHLHGFWHLEAYRAFQEVIKLDSDCAMGYCGLALCQPGFSDSPQVWIDAINQAVAKSKNTSTLEQALIKAVEVLVKNGIAEAQSPFRSLYKTFPNEPEAIALASIMLRQDENKTTQQEVKKLLEDALKRYPENIALMHYYIHVMELRPEFAEAIEVAEKMVRQAPNAPHLLHMPGHLYYLAGAYDKAIKSYERALKLENEYHTTEKIPFLANQNFIHNLQFLVVAQAETGNQALTLNTAQRLAKLNLQSEIRNEGAALMYHYEARILPALVSLRYRSWDKAIETLDLTLRSLDRPIRNNIVRTYYEIMKLYAQGMKAAENQQIQEAIQLGGQLSKLMTRYEQEAMAYQQTSEFKSINETYDIMSMARYELAGWIDNLDKTNPFNDAAWKEAVALQSKIKYDEPPRLIYPVEESLARLHKIRGEKEAYQTSKRLALLKRPNSKTIQTL